MVKPKENEACYATPDQREVLIRLTALPLTNHFFLTGGTALSVFYLYHRISNDIDLFSTDSRDLSRIDFEIRRIWQKESLKINESPYFLSMLIRNVKVDFVIDPLSIREEKPTIMFGNDHSLHIDTMRNIVSNKLCTLISRTEPKDFADFYQIFSMIPETDRHKVYEDAAAKDGIFDDPPTVAFQLENSFGFLKKKPDLFPKMLTNFEQTAFFGFYEDMVKWIYSLASFRSA